MCYKTPLCLFSFLFKKILIILIATQMCFGFMLGVGNRPKEGGICNVG